jgi:hypothetical protein
MRGSFNCVTPNSGEKGSSLDADRRLDSSQHAERVHVQRELDAGRRVKRRHDGSQQLVQRPRAGRLHLVVEAMIPLQPEYWGLGGAE